MTKLQEYRKLAGLSQSQLADKTGIGIRTIQSYESGNRSLENAAAVTVLQFAKALGCTVEDLITEDADGE